MKLILNGGGDGNQVINARKKLNDIIDHNKKILYIPLAWPDEAYTGCLDFITNELSDVLCTGIEMINHEDELLDKDFTDYACIYIGGGNTYKLLYKLKMNGSFNKIKDYLLNHDGIVYGGSAGAIIFGADLDSCNTDDTNEVGLVDNTGFNMIDGYSLLCHYTNRDEVRTLKTKEYLLALSRKKPIYAIPEEDTIYVDNGIIEIIGERDYFEYLNGEEFIHNVGNLKKL